MLTAEFDAPGHLEGNSTIDRDEKGKVGVEVQVEFQPFPGDIVQQVLLVLIGKEMVGLGEIVIVGLYRKAVVFDDERGPGTQKVPGESGASLQGPGWPDSRRRLRVPAARAV